MVETRFDYDWLGYGLKLVQLDNGDERFLQGEEASDLYDTLEENPLDTDRIIEDYFI